MMDLYYKLLPRQKFSSNLGKFPRDTRVKQDFHFTFINLEVYCVMDVL